MHYTVTLDLPDYLIQQADAMDNFNDIANRILRDVLEEEADYRAAARRGAIRGMEDEPDFPLTPADLK